MSNLYNRQEKLKIDKDVSITIVGAGGIGFWVAKFAAMSGIEKIYIFDPDVIEEHNLNRLDIPDKFIGRNKSDVVKLIINSIRPECTIYSFPYKFSDIHKTDTDWLVDCTDNHKSQLENQRLATSFGQKYMKAGYDGESFSIHNSVAEWGEADDGYQIVPSWVVPATIVAALTVAKIMKYKSKEVITNVENLFRIER